MSNVKNLLFTEKYRPKTLDEIVLLPRIREIFKDGVKQNYILHGTYGCGKSTLARILIGEYSKDKPMLSINTSMETSVDVLRGKIDSFCSNVYMGFDLNSTIPSTSTKYVYLDEFDGASQTYQDAFKGFVENKKYIKNVRFILTTNHINKVSNGVKSRFKVINFNCENAEEEKYMKNQYFKRIKEVICPAENIDISKEELVKLINKKFPDFRSMLIALEDYKLSNTLTLDTANENVKLRLDLYSTIYDGNKNYMEIFNFLMNNFGQDKIDEMISMLGKQFVNWIADNKRPNDVEKLFEANAIVTDYASLLGTQTDPIILGMTVIGKLRTLFTQH